MWFHLIRYAKKLDYPIIEVAKLPEFDGFIFGVSTRYGGWPAQFKVRCFSHAYR